MYIQCETGEKLLTVPQVEAGLIFGLELKKYTHVVPYTLMNEEMALAGGVELFQMSQRHRHEVSHVLKCGVECVRPADLPILVEGMLYFNAPQMCFKPSPITRARTGIRRLTRGGVVMVELSRNGEHEVLGVCSLFLCLCVLLVIFSFLICWFVVLEFEGTCQSDIEMSLTKLADFCKPAPLNMSECFVAFTARPFLDFWTFDIELKVPPQIFV